MFRLKGIQYFPLFYNFKRMTNEYNYKNDKKILSIFLSLQISLYFRFIWYHVDGLKPRLNERGRKKWEIAQLKKILLFTYYHILLFTLPTYRVFGAILMIFSSKLKIMKLNQFYRSFHLVK
jgi:hypothetical protein